jgi:hypothetical protein
MSRWWAVSALCMAPLALCSIGMAGRGLLADTPVPTVVILRPAASDEVTTEAVARVRGELKAAGFEVAMLPLSSDDPRHDLETAGRELHPIAAFAIFVKPWQAGSSVAEIWVTDRIKQKTIIQNAVLHDTDRGRGSEILAVRAVELLKASLADFWAPEGPKRPSPPPPTPSARPAVSVHEKEPPVVPFASGVGLGLGAGVVTSFGVVVTTMWAPQAIVSYGWTSGLSVRGTFHGFGPPAMGTLPPPDTTHATARIEQQLLMVEMVKTLWPTWPVVPFAYAGAGTQHLRTTGAVPPPSTGFVIEVPRDDWSLLTTLGAGAGIPMSSGLSLLLQARGLVAWPSTIVRMLNEPVAHLGAPSLLVDGGLLGVFP